jgi:hypothetical protein
MTMNRRESGNTIVIRKILVKYLDSSKILTTLDLHSRQQRSFSFEKCSVLTFHKQGVTGQEELLPVFDVAHVLEDGHDHGPDLLDLDDGETLH